MLATESGDSGLSPEVKGSYTEQLWEPQGLPYLRQEGQEEEPGAQVQRIARACLCALPPPSLGSKAAKVRMAWPGALQASVSSAPPLACLIPVGPSSALATPGSLLYIFETSFYSL